MVFKTKIRLLSIWLIQSLGGYGQCDCTINIDNTQTSVVISPGVMACIPADVNYTGAIVMQGGTLCNYGSLVSQNVDFQSGTINNYGYIFAGNILNITSHAILNNYKTFEVETLTNDGQINLSQKAVLATLNLYNNITGTINGAESIEGDSSNYSAVFVSEISENKGALKQHMVFMDLSYTGSSVYRIDNYYDSGPNIDYPTVLFNVGVSDSGPGGGQFCQYYLSISPNSNLTFCEGASLTFNATLTYMSTSLVAIINPQIPLVWTTSPAQPYGLPSGTYNQVFTVSGAISSYAITVGTSYNGCPVIGGPVVVTLKNLTANAGPSKFIPYGGQTVIGNTPGAVASGGTAPYTYLWTPNSSYVTGSTHNSVNPIVNPQVTTIYQISVSDASSGCTATSTMAVIVEQFPHAVLKRSLDGGYYKVITNNTIYFKYDEEYKNNNSVNLKYKIYMQDHATTAAAYSCAMLTPSYGDNRFALNLSTGCTPALATNQYYVLEVLNEKNEKFYLKFYY